MFIVPDDILEELTCDFCHKYLSVGPVKVDKDRNKICGRCSKENQTAVTSVYRFFGDSAIFKCINRFDGCSVLLTHDQVLKHEEKCISKQYDCPLCNDNKLIPTYEILNHCKIHHAENLLKKCSMKRKVNELKSSHVFFYIKENYIFFIFLEFDELKDVFLLNAFYIGDDSQCSDDVQQKYSIHIDEQNILESQKRDCLPLKSHYKTSKIVNRFKIHSDLPKELNMVIYFEFFVPTRVNQITLKNAMQIETECVKNFKIRQLRCENGYQKYLNKVQVSISDCLTKLLSKNVYGDQIEIYVQCKLCRNVSVDNIYISSHGAVRHLICLWCARVVTTDFHYLNDVIANGLYMLTWYITYSCIWNCGKFNSLNDIHVHEIDCVKMNLPSIRCPIFKCNFNGMFSVMRTHLLDVHNETLWSNFIILYESYKTYPKHNILSLTDRSHFYFWLHPNTLLKCVVQKQSKTTFFIKTTIVGQPSENKNVMIIVSYDHSKNFQRHSGHFMNIHNNLDCSILPVRLHFVLNDE